MAARDEEDYQAKLDKSSRKRARKDEEGGSSTLELTAEDVEVYCIT